MTQIKRDERSLYVKTNSTVYRPVPPEPLFGSWIHPAAIDQKNPYNEHWRQTAFEEGQEATVRHVHQTNFCSVIVGGRMEYWHGHGSYYGPWDPQLKRMPILPTADVWHPRQDETPLEESANGNNVSA